MVAVLVADGVDGRAFVDMKAGRVKAGLEVKFLSDVSVHRHRSRDSKAMAA